jgi:hypothetical protein
MNVTKSNNKTKQALRSYAPLQTRRRVSDAVPWNRLLGALQTRTIFLGCLCIDTRELPAKSGNRWV